MNIITLFPDSLKRSFSFDRVFGLRSLLIGIVSATPIILGAFPAIAGSSVGVVTRIYAHSGDVILFSAGSHQGKPACSTAADEWAFSLTTQSGKAMYALLLTAYAEGKQVAVVGTGTCSAWGDRESPVYIYIP
jgi:hypothetical protein